MLSSIRHSLLLLTACAFAAELPSPSLLVLNKEEATLAIIDPSNGKIAVKIPTGEGPHEVTVSADGRWAFVTNYGTGPKPGNSLSVIDLVAQKEFQRLDLTPLSRPHGVTFSGGKAWFTAEANKVVGRYDPAAHKVDFVIGSGQNSTHMVMFNKDGSRMFTANIAGDSISIFETTGAWNQTVVPVGKGPEGLDISPDGREIWTAHSRDGGVSIIDVAAKKVTGTFDAGTKRSNRIKFTLDGKFALISDLSGNELVVVDAATRKVVKRIAVGKSPEGILIDPRGGRAFIAVTGDNQIAILDLKTLEVTGHLKTGTGPDGMAWR